MYRQVAQRLLREATSCGIPAYIAMRDNKSARKHAELIRAAGVIRKAYAVRQLWISHGNCVWDTLCARVNLPAKLVHIPLDPN